MKRKVKVRNGAIHHYADILMLMVLCDSKINGNFS